MISKKRKIVFSIIAGIFTSFCFVAGYYVDKYDSLDLMSGKFYWQFAIGVVLASAFVYILWEAIERNKIKLPNKLGEIHIPYAVSVVVLLICWLPALLSIFPGVFSYDALEEWMLVRDGTLTSHHPVIHVLLVGGLVEGIYQLTGSYNVGIAVYSILQMILLANIFAYSMVLQKRMNMKAGWQVVSLVFYALSPVIQLFSICATKDVLFFAALLLFIQYLMILFIEKDAFFTKRKDVAGLLVSMFVSMIFRNNGRYIVMIMMVILLWALRKLLKKTYYKVLLIFGSVFLMYGLYTGPFYQVLSVESGGIQEMLSVPIQQMARVYKYNKASLEQEDVEFLYQAIPQENLEYYMPTVSDMVKLGFQEQTFRADWGGYLKLWIKWGVQHPFTYINSFLANTVDFWYPFSIVDGYKIPNATSYFAYRVDAPGTEIIIFPKVHEYYEAISANREIQEQLWTAVFLSPGLYFVVFMIIFFYHWCHRRYKIVIPLLVVWINMLTVLLGPIALVRYVLIYFYGLPIILGTFRGGEDD